MDIKALEMFALVAQEGGLSAAARRTGIPVSTLSRQLQALERQLKRPLVARSTRSFSLTEDGQALLDSVGGPLQQLRAAAQLFHEHAQHPAGLLRVAAAPTIAQHLLPEILARCLARFPALKIELSAAPEPVDLRKASVDVALRVGSISKDPSLVVRRLRRSRLRYVASPRYLSGKGAATLNTLSGHDIIGLLQPDWQLHDDIGRPVEPRIRVPSAAIAHRLCLLGAGVALLPEFLIEDDLRKGRLSELSLTLRRPSRDVFLAYTPQARRSPRVRAFIDLVLEETGSTSSKLD